MICYLHNSRVIFIPANWKALQDHEIQRVLHTGGGFRHKAHLGNFWGDQQPLDNIFKETDPGISVLLLSLK